MHILSVLCIDWVLGMQVICIELISLYVQVFISSVNEHYDHYLVAISNPIFWWESCKGSVWESVKNCSSVCKEVGTRGWLAAASCQIDAHVPSMPEAEASRQLFTTGQKSQAGQAICSRFELATLPSCEVKLLEHPVWHNMTFHIPSHPTIYIPLYPRFKESFQREFWERNPRENKIDSSTIFT